jgi:hypothetical protein
MNDEKEDDTVKIAYSEFNAAKEEQESARSRASSEVEDALWGAMTDWEAEFQHIEEAKNAEMKAIAINGKDAACDAWKAACEAWKQAWQLANKTGHLQEWQSEIRSPARIKK